MTFKNIQDAVISNRFDETDRADVKNWINDCYDGLVGAEDWAFKVATDAVTVTSGSVLVSGIATDFGVARSLITWDGVPLRYLTSDEYEDAFFGVTTTGKPTHYTVEGSTVKVGPISNESSAAYQLLYEKDVVALSADGDLPILPTNTHMVLVYGAAAIGLTLAQDFYGSMEMAQKFEDRKQAMKQRYLIAARKKQRQSPAYRGFR